LATIEPKNVYDKSAKKKVWNFMFFVVVIVVVVVDGHHADERFIFIDVVD
jgi:hypothetical protein